MSGQSVDIDYAVRVWKEGNEFVAHALPLDVMSSGTTEPEACAALDEAVTLFILTASDMGTLDDVLQECGYDYQDGRWKSPPTIQFKQHTLSILA